MVQHVVDAVAGERTARDAVDIVLIVHLLPGLDDSDARELTFTEELLALEFGREVRRRDLGTEPWGLPCVAEVCSRDRRVVSGVYRDVAPDLIPQPSAVERQDVDGLTLDLSDPDGQVTLLALGDELVVELGIGVEGCALTDLPAFEGLDDLSLGVD